MSAFSDRPNTALLIVDVQRDVVANAHDRDGVMVGDAHTTEDPSNWGIPLNAEQVIAHTNSYWRQAAAPGRSGGTVATAEVDFGSKR